ncbi:hypothetical protein FS837_009163 [Tulasnella sp. UAMH 9824]|nr:hypothetical protein FS837_009163 [Tulasnella sp. UAMH 9824]
MSPPITLFLTTIASEPRLRARQGMNSPLVKQIPFSAYDMASDERARKLWKRKVPAAKQQLPGFLVDNTFIGTVEDFEAAVEAGDHVMRKFLRLDEEYNEELERAWNTPAPEVVPIGVPGVQKPSEISGHQTVWHGPKDKPIDRSKVVKHDAKLAEGEIDLTETLGEFGLEGVVVTEDELAELVAELNLNKEEAANLVKGIAEASAAANPPSPPTPPPTEDEPKAEKEEEIRKPVQLHGKPEVHIEPVLNPDAPPLPLPPQPKGPSTPPKKSPAPPVEPAEPASSPPAKPIVKVDTSAASPPRKSTLPASTTPVIAESPGLLTPASAIPVRLASRETLAQLAQKVEAKRRSRTDAKPRRIPSLSSPNSPLFPSSPAPDGEYELPTIEEAREPIRQRKPSQIESAKPKVAFPVTDPTEAYAADPTSPQPTGDGPVPRPSQIPVPTSSSSQPTRTRVVSTTSRGGSLPPPSAVTAPTQSSAPPTTSATPSRSRTTSQHRPSSSAAPVRERKQSTTRAPPSAFKPEDAPPLPTTTAKSASKSSTSATPSRSSTTGPAASSKPATPSRSNSSAGAAGSATPVRERKKSAYGASRPTLPPSTSSPSVNNDGKGSSGA